MKDFFSASSSKRALKAYRKIREDLPENEVRLGLYNSYHYLSDPKRLGFMFARYKFVSKMFQGFDRVLEIGCQEGLGSYAVSKAVRELVAVDFYKPHVDACLKNIGPVAKNILFKGHDILAGSVGGSYDGVFALDVLEHIDPKQEKLFFRHVVSCLKKDGVCILGIPSLESQKYASVESRRGHFNCKSGEALSKLCRTHFHRVFMFGMNDEVLHTGFLPMCHYLLALCVGPKASSKAR